VSGIVSLSIIIIILTQCFRFWKCIVSVFEGNHTKHSSREKKGFEKNLRTRLPKKNLLDTSSLKIPIFIVLTQIKQSLKPITQSSPLHLHVRPKERYGPSSNTRTKLSSNHLPTVILSHCRTLTNCLHQIDPDRPPSLTFL
jgi:hypothetical protein